MKKHNLLILTCLLITAMWLAACDGQPTPRPTGDLPPGSLLPGEAVVDSLDILILESFPVQVNVIARGYLPDGCTELDTITQERLENSFEIIITTARPAGAVCTEQAVPWEKTFTLDVYGLPAGAYTVDVNGVTGSFELAIDNVLQEP